MRQMLQERPKGESEGEDDRKPDGDEFAEGKGREDDAPARIVLREANLEKIDEERRRHVDEDVFEVEQGGEEEGGFDVTALKDARDGEQEETEEEAVVLKMNVIDEKEAEIGEKAKDDDHLSVLHGGDALENGGRR